MSIPKGPVLGLESTTTRIPASSAMHVVQFYEKDEALIEEVTRLVGTALVSGDAAMLIATDEHRSAVESELQARGLNVDKPAEEGRFVSLSAAGVLTQILSEGMPDEEKFLRVVGGTIEKVKAAARAKDANTVIFGEMVALLWLEGKQEAAIRLEELWNQAAVKYGLSLRCAYPIGGFHEQEHGKLFARVCAEHGHVLPVGSQQPLLSGDEQLRAIAELQQRLEVLEYEKALHDSEQRFRLLVEAVRDYAIFMLDAEGYVTSWNLGAERLKGYKPEEIIGKHFSRFYTEEDLKAEKPKYELETAISEGRVEDEGWRVRQDGSRFWANVVITVLKNPEGQVIGFAKVTRDFTTRVQTERALQEAKRRLQDSEKSLRDLSLHLLRSQDEERKRIGRDLHDSLGQYLSVLKMKLDTLRMAAVQQPGDYLEDLTQCVQLTEDAVKEVRTISYLLYPPMLEEMGLKSAIPWYLEGFTKRSGIKTAFEATPNFGRISADVELALFRVLQESLTNVHRHSGSQTAHVRLGLENDTVVLEISDQGKGAQLENFEKGGVDWMGAVGVGLRGMNERVRQIGGRLDLSSSKEGTTVTAIVPGQKTNREETTS